MEAKVEQKEESEEESLRRKNLFLHRAEENFTKPQVDQSRKDSQIISNFLDQVEEPTEIVAKNVCLGKKTDYIEQPGRARPTQITLHYGQDEQGVSKKLNKLPGYPAQ